MGHEDAGNPVVELALTELNRAKLCWLYQGPDKLRLEDETCNSRDSGPLTLMVKNAAMATVLDLPAKAFPKPVETHKQMVPNCLTHTPKRLRAHDAQAMALQLPGRSLFALHDRLGALERGGAWRGAAAGAVSLRRAARTALLRAERRGGKGAWVQGSEVRSVKRA